MVQKFQFFCVFPPLRGGNRKFQTGRGGVLVSDKLKQDVSIGSNLRRLRKKAKLSQQDVSIKLDLLGLSTSREIVSRMERGQYSIRISVLRALKDIYKVDSYDEFFRDL